jgi:anti-sigma regulatory factor (Ser/Thr protein kinase)/CheY-like chemotaxis protein
VARAILVDVEPVLLEALKRSSQLAGVEFEPARGEADALRRLRRRTCDVVISSARTHIAEDLPFADEARKVRPGVKVILLAPEAAPADLIAALRRHVYACFRVPFEIAELAEMLRRAIDDDERWRDGIEVISAQPDWVSLRLACRMVTAERAVHFLSELRADSPDIDRDGLFAAFREILLNAMEHGTGFDPDQVVEVAAVRTARSIVFYVRDPGPGYEPRKLAHAALTNPADDPIAHMRKRDEMGLRPGGFGLLMARNIVDEMILSERGNEVLLIRYTR